MGKTHYIQTPMGAGRAIGQAKGSRSVKTPKMRGSRMTLAQDFIEMVHKLGEKKYEVKKVYRRIQDRELFLSAYSKLYANKGAMTPGVDPNDTVQGMSLTRIDHIIDDLKNNAYQWQPVRRIEIPKKHGTQKRPLGLPVWRDKLLQEVIRTVLEAYYEPQFSEHSHGFRPNKGCHTALREIGTWKGTKWFIEGDIKGCFDHIDFNLLLEIMGRQIKDDRLLKLLKEMLQAGYVHEWQYHTTYSGTPQGGVISPLLANIYLNELDQFIENELIPSYTRGETRKRNPEYERLSGLMRYANQTGNINRYQELERQRRQLPTKEMDDPDYRRLKYVRYADDFILGFIGPHLEALEVKEKVKQFLRTLHLTLSDEKTLITHATTGRARFLNYEIYIAQNNTQLTRHKAQAKLTARAINGVPIFKVPQEVINDWSTRFSKNGKTVHRPYLMECSDYEITQTYDLEFRGLANYYSFAHNICALSKVRYHYLMSLAKTIAAKHKQKLTWVFAKYKPKANGGAHTLRIEVPNPHNPDKPLMATFGDKPLGRNTHVTVKDSQAHFYHGRNELVSRLLANECELCGSSDRIRGHHVHKLAEVKKKYQGREHPPQWAVFMMERNRKVVFVCHRCHTEIHAGRYDGEKVE
jgi:group II intron reverse transcriptase/maturase